MSKINKYEKSITEANQSQMKMYITGVLGLQVFSAVCNQDRWTNKQKESNVPCSKKIVVKQLMPRYRLLDFKDNERILSAFRQKGQVFYVGKGRVAGNRVDLWHPHSII